VAESPTLSFNIDRNTAKPAIVAVAAAVAAVAGLHVMSINSAAA